MRWKNSAALLAAHKIAAVADIRRFPASRRFPHFNSAALKEALAEMRHRLRMVRGPRRPAQHEESQR